MVSGAVSVGKLLKDGDTISLGKGLTLEVFHTPGHSPGSVSLLLREEMALFTGDTVQTPGFSGPFYTDPVALVRSIQRLKGIPGIKHYLPAHDTPAEGKAVYQRFKDSLAYIRRIHAAVKKVASECPENTDPQVFAGRVLDELGIFPGTSLPFIAKTIHADLTSIGLDELLKE